MTQRIVLAAIAFALAYTVARNAPDIVRYIKMTRM
jgi:hypothetical protein